MCSKPVTAPAHAPASMASPVASQGFQPRMMQAAATAAPSGLVYRGLVAGSGPSPAATDTVRVHYRGTFTDGKEFDSSLSRGKPAEFPLNRVIRCWTEGVQKIKVGGKAKLVCPANLAYGSQGRPGIPANSTLIFEVELLDIVR